MNLDNKNSSPTDCQPERIQIKIKNEVVIKKGYIFSEIG